MNKCALICEDNMTTAHCIKGMLEKLDYKTTIAQSANEALTCLKKHKYDLLTLDIILPDENGFYVLKEMQNIELAKDLPVIVISETKKENADLRFDNNIVYWMEKSFDITSFNIALKNIIEQKNKVEVLYVEHDEDLLILIDVNLSDFANVTKINNLIDAKEILEKNKFDIIILDYVFPEGTSDKLIPTIKLGVNKDSKLIMFSAYEECKIISDYFDEIIIKSMVSFDEFKECIERLL